MTMDDKNPGIAHNSANGPPARASSSAQESILKAHWSAAGTTLIRKISIDLRW
jgi:hypothetical protein